MIWIMYAHLPGATKNDIDKVIESNSKIIHLFIATSDIHMKYKLNKTRDQVFDSIIESIDYAKGHGMRIIFSPEDATRTDMDFLKHIIFPFLYLYMNLKIHILMIQLLLRKRCRPFHQFHLL